MANTPGSGRRTGDHRSNLGGRKRSAVGEDSDRPVFHPSIGAATHARWALENTVRFTRNKSTTVRTGEAPKEIQMNSPEPFGDAPALGQDSKRRLRRLIEAGIRRVGHLVGSFCRDEVLGRR